MDRGSRLLRTCVGLAIALGASACQSPTSSAVAGSANAIAANGGNAPMRIEDHFSGRERELAEAAASGDVERVNRLVRESRVDPNAQSAQGMPLLLWAVHARNLAGFEALLANGADPSRRARNGELLMHYVVEGGGADFVRAALARGANPNQENRDREPLIHIARRVGDWDSVRALVEGGARIDAPAGGLRDNTILSIATGFGDFEHALWLLEHGADPTLRIADAVAPEVIGTQPILEDIFHRPLDPQATQALAYQKRCQQLVLARGLVAPPRPRRFALSE
jgi:ankyrin repeat protein